MHVINHHLIECIKKVLVVGSIATKISVNSITNSIGWNLANAEGRVTKWSIGKDGSHFLGFVYKA